MAQDIWDIDTFIAWDSLLTEEEIAVRDSVTKFVQDKCMPHIGDDFEQGRFRPELAEQLGSLGLLGANLKGYGCAGISSVAYGLACHELEACDSGLRSFVSVQTSLTMYAIWQFGSEEQKQRLLPELASGRKIGCFGLTESSFGSHPGGMRTIAKKDGDDWVLNGEKMWITSAQVADVAVVWAQTTDDSKGIRGFIVEKGTKGFSAQNIPHKLSMRASATGSLHFDEMRIPDENRLPEASGLSSPLACLTNARFGVAFGVLGAAKYCLNRAIAYSKERVQYGGPIASKQLIQKKLADMASEIVKASLLSLHYGRLKDKGKLHSNHVSLLKRNNCRIALDAAREARSILGANGITTEYDVLRHAVNLESTLTYEGTEEIHSLVIGHALTGVRAY
ncbi:MAG: acyl-CoA dehydrogenase [Deltaproteobacteria bacterium]|nr:acyl-CoA dehydrogenase [Deltaproteobacteria bacterium]